MRDQSTPDAFARIGSRVLTHQHGPYGASEATLRAFAVRSRTTERSRYEARNALAQEG